MEQSNHIGRRIRSERKRLQISQETLASDLNVSVNYIGEIERGKRIVSLNMAEKFCHYFHLTLDYLYWGISPEIPPEQLICCADPHRELLSLMESCSDQELQLCLNVLKPILTYWHSDRN